MHAASARARDRARPHKTLKVSQTFRVLLWYNRGVTAIPGGQLDLFGRRAASAPYTISQLTSFIRDLIEGEPALSDVWVEGEVSNFTRASSGHCYFTLKDAGAQIGCVMWRSIAQLQRYLPANGDQVLAHGRVGVYETGGRYQLYADHLEPAGLGSLYLEFERLKARLLAEGLFAPERKRPLPRFPRRIGLVTSPAAAALRDIVTVLRRRYPLAELLLAPTLVQGEGAPAQIVAALQALAERGRVDVIIVARGGGSLEELWAFNDERVVRAIAGSPVPVICGVGHETDVSLADFAADVRAPTPSAAAELVAPDRAELRAMVAGLAAAQVEAALSLLEELRWRLADRQQALRHFSPEARVQQVRQRVDEWQARIGQAASHRLALERERLAGLSARLVSLSPLATLERGYAIVRHGPSGAIVRSPRQVSAGDALAIRVAEGEFGAEVKAQPAGM